MKPRGTPRLPDWIFIAAAMACCGCMLRTEGSLSSDAGETSELPAGDDTEVCTADCIENAGEPEDQPLPDGPDVEESRDIMAEEDEEESEACECAPGDTSICTHSCGAEGTQECAEDCASWGPCVIIPEGISSCNGQDDDCDGSVDEGCVTSLVFPDPPVETSTAFTVTTSHDICAICVYLAVSGPCGTYHQDVMVVTDPNPPPCAWRWEISVPAPGDYHIVFIHQPHDPGCSEDPQDCLCDEGSIIEGDLHVTGSGSCP